jgi:hypothetical protein
MKDGLLGKCKECTKIDVRSNYRKEIDKKKEYERKRAMLPHRVMARISYAKTEGGKLAYKRAKKKYIDNNPIKRSVHNKLNAAVRDGKIMKPKVCEQCNGGGRICGYHEDYSKPLDVEWLCSKCHKARHVGGNEMTTLDAG